MNIYEYNEKHQLINDEIELAEGILDDELLSKLSLLDINRSEVIETEHRKIKNDVLMAGAIKSEIKAMGEKLKNINLKISKDSMNLEKFMGPELAEGKTIKNAIGEIKFSLKGGACELNDNITVDDIPVEFQDIKKTANIGEMKKQLKVRPELKKYVHLTDKYRELSVK
jgi:hypothetical protein